MFSATTAVGAPLDLSQRSSRNSNIEIENNSLDKSTANNHFRKNNHNNKKNNLKSNLIEKKISQLKKTLDFPTNETIPPIKHGGLSDVPKQFRLFEPINKVLFFI